jgi:hypothetical protein
LCVFFSIDVECHCITLFNISLAKALAYLDEIKSDY